jgi:phosphonate metabolism protein PhnN/1,5-bisphosphokinase (PRPP-forming)
VAVQGQDGRGVLILVVGPSGAGKDTLIAGARERFARDPRFVFARRIITRSPGSAGEDHIALDEAEFERQRCSGAFALAWRAHGLSYALPASIAADLSSSRHVIANVSRTVVVEAGKRFAPARCIFIDAGLAARASRLALRRRESAEQVAERLASLPRESFEPADWVIRNEGSVREGIDVFTAAIASLTHAPHA